MNICWDRFLKSGRSLKAFPFSFLLCPPLPSPSPSLSSWEDPRPWFGVSWLTYLSSVPRSFCRERLVFACSVNLSGHLLAIVCPSLSLHGSWLGTAPLHLSPQADVATICTWINLHPRRNAESSAWRSLRDTRSSLPCEEMKAQKMTYLS